MHFWLQNSAGADRGVIYTAVAGGHVYLRTYNQQTFTFGTDGDFYAPANIRSAAATYAGAAYMNTDGNISGSVWGNWGAGDAYSAINARIEARATAWANDRVSRFQYRKVSTGAINIGGEVHSIVQLVL